MFTPCAAFSIFYDATSTGFVSTLDTVPSGHERERERGRRRASGGNLVEYGVIERSPDRVLPTIALIKDDAVIAGDLQESRFSC